MKKSILVAVSLLFATGLFAQNYHKSVGLRIGTEIGASYKQFFSPKHALEGILDLNIFHGNTMNLAVTGLYEFHFNVDVDGLSLYVGPGASVGAMLGDNSGLYLAINGVAGIEYKLYNVPVALSLDWLPAVAIIHNAGFFPGGLGLTVRYTF